MAGGILFLAVRPSVPHAVTRADRAGRRHDRLYRHGTTIMSMGCQGGLAFREEGDPDYLDFIHFTLVIGATADITFTSRRMRRVGTLHTILAFGFNTAILGHHDQPGGQFPLTHRITTEPGHIFVTGQDTIPPR
jgi:hypothetical protein